MDSPVEVTLSPEGDPSAFILDRFEYDIVGAPQVYFTRQPWWGNPTAPDRIDSEFWRVDASRPDQELIRYDLRRDPAGAWFLATSWQ
jgi:hypothetical protein